MATEFVAEAATVAPVPIATEPAAPAEDADPTATLLTPLAEAPFCSAEATPEPIATAPFAVA
jgi:hypothetical protein